MSVADNVNKVAKVAHKKVINFFLGDEFEDYSDIYKGGDVDLSVYRYPSFSSVLNYRYYDKSTNLFLNKSSAGFLYRIAPLTGANENLAEQLDALLRSKITEQHTFQVLKVTHNKVGGALDRCAAQFKQEGLSSLSRLGDHLEKYWKKAAEDKFFTQNDVHAKLMHTEVYLVIDKALDDDLDSMDIAEIKADMALFKRGFEASLQAANIGFMLCPVESLMRLVSFYLKPDVNDLYDRVYDYDDERALNEQFTNKDFGCEVSENGIYIEGVSRQLEEIETAVSVLTLSEPPKEHALNQNIDLSNNIYEKNASVNCNHILSVTYKVEGQAKAQYKANRKTNSLNKKANSQYAVKVAGTVDLANQWKSFRDNLTLKKTKSVKVLYNLVLFSKVEEQGQDIQLAKTAFAYSGIQLTLCKRQQLPYFLASMPFMFSGHLEKDFSLPMMMWPVSSWNAVQMMPLLADWSGNANGILLPTVRNQTAFIDPFSGVFGTGYNIAVSGMTRGGKSFLMQMMMLNVLFNGGDIFIIDVGGSYKKMTNLLGGVYLEYDNLAMNPFTHVKNIGDEIDDIIKLFVLLVLPQTGASEDDTGTIRQAILNAFSKNGNATIIDDVQAELIALYDENSKIYGSAGILAKNLSPYCKDAEHGDAFNLPSKLDPNARMIVVDLKQIEKKNNIKLPVLLSVISQFQRRMFDSDRSKQKMCIMDEAWQFLQGNSVASEFIVSGYRTGSRHMCSFVTITQGISDYTRFEHAKVIWENAALRLIFKQESSSLNQYNKDTELLTDYELRILNTFPKPQEVGYSEVLIKADTFSSFNRLFVDPFTLVALSSKGPDYQAVENYAAAGMDYVSAIDKVAHEHYGAMYA